MTQGISLGLYSPRYSSGYGDLRHLPTVLVENHSLKSFRQRVLGTRVLLEASLKVLGANAASLSDAIAEDSAARPERVPMNWTYAEGRDQTIDFLGTAYETYVSPASGAKEVRWLGTPKTYPDSPCDGTNRASICAAPKSTWCRPRNLR